MICLITLPSIFILYLQVEQEKQNAIDTSVKLSQTISAQIAQVQRKAINKSHLFLINLSQLPIAQIPEKPECNNALKALVKLEPSYSNIGIPLVSGDLVCSAFSPSKPVNVKDREYIQKAIKNKEFTISKLQVDRATNEVSINFAYPIFKSNTDDISALVVAVMSLDSWSDELSLYNLPEGSVAFISDAEDTIIAAYPKTEGLIGKKIYDNKYITQHNAQNDISFSNGRALSQEIIYENEGKDEQSLKITIIIPITDLLNQAENTFYRNLVIDMVIICIFAAIGFIYLNKNILIPINNLLQATENLEKGKEVNLKTNVGASEISLLGKKFKKMASTRLLSEQALLAKNHELNSIFSALPDTYIRVNDKGVVLDYRGEENSTDFIGKSIGNLFSSEVYEKFSARINKIKSNKEIESWKFSQYIEKQLNTFEARIVKISNANEFVIIIQNVTDKEHSQQVIWQQANYDSLTSLPNRKLFLETLDKELLNAQENNQNLALLFIDLDNFKEVNDTLGHHIGDILLTNVAQRLSSCVRKKDIVARLGGDEFTIIITDLSSNENIINNTAQRILDTIGEPMTIGDNTCYISPSIGIAVFPEDFENSSNLIKAADQAMFAAKKEGRNRYHYYHSGVFQGSCRLNC